MDIDKSAAEIKVLILDVDGVLTDGNIILDGQGQEFKAFNTKDGQGIKTAIDAGLTVAIITGRHSQPVLHRARELGIELVLQGVQDKASAMEGLLKEYGWRAEEVAYMGDDLPDLPPMRRAGLAISVSDAAEEVIEAADYVTTRPGGRGAVREAIEYLLKASHRWDQIINKYSR